MFSGIYAGFSGCLQDRIRINFNPVSLHQSTVFLSDVRLDGCPDVNSSSSTSCMTLPVDVVSQGFELSTLDNGLRPFTGLSHTAKELLNILGETCSNPRRVFNAYQNLTGRGC